MTQAPRNDAFLDPELMAYVDGRLDAAAAQAFEARLAGGPQERAEAASLRLQTEAIRAAAAAMDVGPTNLRTAALERSLAQALKRRRLQSVFFGPSMRNLAAGVALFAAGWGAHWAQTGPADPYPGYVAESVGAHRVFANDLAHPVEFGGDDAGRAIGWISAKLERKLSNPSLAPLGLDMVGARMLGTREGPIAQFVYEDRDGHRLSLFVAAHPQDELVSPLIYASVGADRVGYWRDAELDYAVVADTSDLQIEAVAQEVSLLLASNT